MALSMIRTADATPANLLYSQTTKERLYMPQGDRTVTYRDPRTLDGDAYEVASATFKQAEAVATLLEEALDDCFVFARNAEMERECLNDGEPDGAHFNSTPLGKRLSAIMTVAESISPHLNTTRKAASYNPKKPPTE